MTDRQAASLKKIFREISRIDYIRPGEFPNINIYMDQVTTFMNSRLCKSKIRVDDKLLTKTMINNYTKNELLPPPEKKKYSQEHMILLVFIYYLKSFLPISEIQDMLTPLTRKFFSKENNESGVSMESIYNVVYHSIKSNISSLNHDVRGKFTATESAFANVKNDDDREFLQTFLTICMLCYDVFMKKQIIESLIETIAPAKPEGNESEKKDEKK